MLIVYDIPGFAYHRRAEAILKYAPADFDVTITPGRDHLRHFRGPAVGYDLIFLLDYASASAWRESIDSQGFKKPPLLVSFNRDSNSRQVAWSETLRSADLTIVNNMDRFEAAGRRPGTVCISNGVDTSVFRSIAPVAERENVVIWSGSGNPTKSKGYDSIIKPLERLLPNLGYRVWFRPIHKETDRFDTQRMVDFYNSAAFILCASATEGTPNTTLEGMACGCVPVTTWVGNVREFGVPGVNCLKVDEPSPAAFARAISSVTRATRIRIGEQAITTMADWDWKIRSQVFFRLFRRVIEHGAKSISPYCYLTEGIDGRAVS